MLFSININSDDSYGGRARGTINGQQDVMAVSKCWTAPVRGKKG